MLEDIYKGDSIEFECTADENITDYKIKCAVWDKAVLISKATANAGGADTQIKITNAVTGIFSVYIIKGETASMERISQIEIEMETPGGKSYTVYREYINFQDSKIN